MNEPIKVGPEVCNYSPGKNIRELWVDDHGNLYLQMSNWGGFWQVTTNCYGCNGRGQGRVYELPDSARLLIRDGKVVP